jgi:hypothetical protein
MLHRTRHDAHAVERQAPSRVRDRRVLRRGAQHRERFVDELPALRHGHAERGVFLRREPSADTQLDTATTQKIERRDAFGNMNGVMVRERDDRDAQTQPRRSLRERGEHELRGRGMRVAGQEMMLDQPHPVESEPVGVLDLRRAVGEDLGLAASEAGRYRELVEEIEEQVRAPSRFRAGILPAIRRQRIERPNPLSSPTVRSAEPSTRPYEDPLSRIDWNHVARDCWWLPPETLSLAGVAEFEALPLEVRRRLSHYEYAHILEVGIWLEALLVERLARLVRRSSDFEHRSRCLDEIREEAGHSLMFVELARRSGVTLPAGRSPGLRIAEALGRGVPSGSALFWAMVVIGEELPYRLARRLERGIQEVMLSAVVYRIAQIHGRDEASHASYARLRCEEETIRLPAWRRALLAPALSRALIAFSTYLYFPPTAVYRCAGLPPGTRWRSLALRNPARRNEVRGMSRPTVQFLRRLGWSVSNP